MHVSIWDPTVLNATDPEVVASDVAERPYSRFQTGLALNLLGAVFNQGSTFVFNVIAANVLGQPVFGKYGIVASTLATLTQVSQLACGYTATKYVAEFRSSDTEKTGRIIGMLLVCVATAALIAGVALLVSASWLANSIFKAPGLSLGLKIGAGVVFLNVLIGLFMGALAGLEAYGALSRSLVAYGAVYLVICCATTYKLGLNGAFAGLLLSAVIGWLLLFVALVTECKRQQIRIHFGPFPEARSILLNFALPAAISGATYLPAIWIGNSVLVRQPNGFAQMALFSAAFTLMTAVLFVPNNTYVVGWSILNHHKGLGQAEGYARAFRANVTVVAGAAIGGAVIFATVGPELLRLFGKAFTVGYSALLVMLGAAIPQALALAILQRPQSQERMWGTFLAVTLPRDILLVALAFYLVPRYGALGLGFAYAAAWVIALLVTIELTYSRAISAARRVVS